MPSSNLRMIAAPHTPFDRSGELNLAVVDQQIALLVEDGVDGAFVGGTTGECASMTIDERMSLAERWISASPAELEVLVHVGSNCQADARQLARHAQAQQVDAIAALAPSYFKPTRVDDLIDFLVPIAAEAPELPFYFYDIPVMTNVRLPMLDFLSKAKDRIPNLAGLKYSNPDLVQLQECLRVSDGEFEILFGCDEILLSAVALGVNGAIGSTYNFLAPLYRSMLAAFERGDYDLAQEMQAQSVAVVQVLTKHGGFMPSCKAAMSFFGVDCGPVRSPFRQFPAGDLVSLRQDLEAAGIFFRHDMNTIDVAPTPVKGDV